MPDTRVIINPSAQHGVTQRLVEAVQGLFSEQDAEVIITQEPLHAVRLAAESAEAGARRVVAVGGDGTINEIVNGLMRIDEDRRPALGIIPSGSGNDIARLCHVPVGLSRAFLVLEGGHTHRFDVGRCNDRYFFSSFSVGLDALVVAKTVEYKTRQNSAGLTLYLRALLFTAFRNFHSIRLQIAYDDKPAQESAVMLCSATNGKTYGGGIRINPWAEPDDGLLASSIVSDISKPKFIAAIPLLAIARQDILPEYHGCSCKRMLITSAEEVAVMAQTDGEIFSSPRFEVSIVPNTLEVIVPA